jgi:N-acetylglucosaminyldiphosphoundecaprenol N-acetyl-beta-D-mannosaminyltransferase
MILTSQSVGALQITTKSFIAIENQIFTHAIKHQSTYVCVANVHMTIEAYWDSNFAKAVNNADIVTADGMPLVLALKALYGIKQERVAGMDLLPSLLKQAEEAELGVYFYGGTTEMLEKTKDYIKVNFPKLEKVSFESPPFRKLTDEEETDCIHRINESGAQLIFVALGCPKQEKWMASMKGKINACMIGIGGALPVLVGMQKRAPEWMQRWSLEWLFRLMQEPRRLFKRYFITNSLFIYLFVIQYIKLKLFKKK